MNFTFSSARRKTRPVIHSIVAALGRIVPVRHRYMVTRDGRLRLRYALPPAMAVVLALGITLPQMVSAPEFKVASLEEAGPEIAGAPPQPVVIADAPLPPGPAVVARKPAGPREKAVEIGRGDTLASIMHRAGVSETDTHGAVKALEKLYNPRSLRPGQKVFLEFNPRDKNDASGYEFASMMVNIDALRTVSLKKEAEGEFAAAIEEKETQRVVLASTTPIELSFYASAQKARIPHSIIEEVIRIYSWDVDFQRDVQRGDVVDVMYDQHETEEGVLIKGGNVLYARLNIGGKDIPVYRYEAKDGRADYYTADGKNVRKALMTTPVDGARISSGFGMRRHPVLGYNKMHKGMDFAAPTGTPIYAAGDGTVEYVGKNGAYGNYVRLRHNSGIKTAYAHMQKFGKGLKSGARVRQGEVIGYVGTTGRSTGPHLHYEILVNGTQVNPKSVTLPQGESLKGTELAAFKAHAREIDHRFQAIAHGERYAAAPLVGERLSRLR